MVVAWHKCAPNFSYPASAIESFFVAEVLDKGVAENNIDENGHALKSLLCLINLRSVFCDALLTAKTFWEK